MGEKPLAQNLQKRIPQNLFLKKDNLVLAVMQVLFPYHWQKHYHTLRWGGRDVCRCNGTTTTTIANVCHKNTNTYTTNHSLATGNPGGPTRTWSSNRTSLHCTATSTTATTYT